MAVWTLNEGPEFGFPEDVMILGNMTESQGIIVPKEDLLTVAMMLAEELDPELRERYLR